MNYYNVSFTYQGNRYSQMVKASSPEAARRLILGQNPGCVIEDVVEL